MTSMTEIDDCAKKCWLVAAAIGLVVALLSLAGAKGILAALVLGGLAAFLLGRVFIWFACAPIPTAGDGAASTARTGTGGGAAGPASSVAGTTAASETAAKVAEARRADAATDPSADLGPAAAAAGVPGAATTDAGAAEEPLVKPSKPLAGQEDLASRKGTWKYEASADDADAAAEGTRPTALEAPRGGSADDLKQIKGVGPRLEELLHELGIYHFDQIAGWSADEVAWMDSNLKGFRGRVSRDDWVGQAKSLASGGAQE
ncbi:NADH-ubiquinone oxidoreductase chain E [Salipiger mucosus]|uniref:NADH-ubiquinone oxidoreductase chain E n=1 Tax=Salipiger mucosus DSM 16094 TaxID=1123237 RepID=S9QGA3_9RHOB|nr:NADH-ubiquinone oxidoreductase chain E [Salipiger mucosus]EPX80461.1 NADH-ubiquinone oxidoreductase chain E [Salipiger mucosus DSM 16094]